MARRIRDKRFWALLGIGLAVTAGVVLFVFAAQPGLRGESATDNGVVGWTGASNMSGVYGHSQVGIGVTGHSDSMAGVVGETGASNRAGVYGYSQVGKGVVGRSDNNDGVVGWTGASDASGVFGHSLAGTGVRGESSNGDGIEGRSDNDNGVVGWTGAAAPRSGVFGHSQNGIGVAGRSYGNVGVEAVTSSSNSDHVALAARNEGSGPAIYAESGTMGTAAIFAGNVQIRSRSTGATLIELGEGLDYAEGFDVSDKNNICPGTVLVIDPDNPGKLAVSNKPYDRKVAGIVTGARGLGSGVRLGSDQFDYDVALAGRVYCNVDASYGEVSPGDLLTTSLTPGYAMVVRDYAKAQGAILGKAMEELPYGKKGQILVLVTLQ